VVRWEYRRCARNKELRHRKSAGHIAALLFQGSEQACGDTLLAASTGSERPGEQSALPAPRSGSTVVGASVDEPPALAGLGEDGFRVVVHPREPVAEDVSARCTQEIHVYRHAPRGYGAMSGSPVAKGVNQTPLPRVHATR
jgi:hypothetical protein